MPSGFLMIRLVVAGPLAASKVASNRFVAFSAAGPEPSRTAPLVQHHAVAHQQPCTWGVLTNSLGEPAVAAVACYTPRGRCPTLGQLSWFRPASFYFVSVGGVR